MIQMIKRFILIIICSFILSGCWSSEEIDQTSIVHGVGVDKVDDQLAVSVEIVKPTGEETDNLGESGNIGNQLVLDIRTDTILQGARELIKYTKRRLNFSQVQAWIVGQPLAQEDFIKSLDIIRRDQMFRLNSYLFITKNKPTEVLDTSTLYEDLVATELSSSFEQTNYTTEFAPITLREFYKFIEGPIENAYVPLILLNEVNGQTVTEIEGTAVIKEGKLVGELSRNETAGLNILLDRVNGGNIQVDLNEQEKISLELEKLKTKIKPILKGNELFVTVDTEINGTLADNMTDQVLTLSYINELEKRLAKETKETINKTLTTLQKKHKTDIVQFGLKTYRKYPKEWREVQAKWDDTFANATVDVQVNVNINHKGLINENVRQTKDNHKNPSIFKWHKEYKE